LRTKRGQRQAQHSEIVEDRVNRGWPRH
jgi:hypothetical protein